MIKLLDPTDSELNGILLVDKPSGITSHDVVYRVRKTLGIKRVGHAGTLDPLATGLLIILVGRATRISQFLIGLDKCYEGTMKFGEITDSHDSDGKIMEIREVKDLSINYLRAFAVNFEGEHEQIPPMFSAKKLNGKPLYKLARKGYVVERVPTAISIKKFTIDNLCDAEADFFVHCSKGTYVRTLVHDYGQKLGCGAHLKALRRTEIGDFKINDAYPLAAICEMSSKEIQKIMLTSYLINNEAK